MMLVATALSLQASATVARPFDVAEELEKDLPGNEGGEGVWVPQLKTAIEFLEKQDEEQRGLGGKVGLSASSDRAAKSRDVTTATADTPAAEETLLSEATAEAVSVSVDLNKGTYPRELRLTYQTDIKHKEGKLQEEFSKLLLNYDYHPRPYLEIFGFAERFDDSYLSIAARYEAGFGAKLEKEWGLAVTKKDRAALITYLRSAYGSDDTLPGNTPAPRDALWRVFRKDSAAAISTQDAQLGYATCVGACYEKPSSRPCERKCLATFYKECADLYAEDEDPKDATERQQKVNKCLAELECAREHGALTAAERHFARTPGATFGFASIDKLRAFLVRVHEIEDGYAKDHARLAFGFSTAVFTELERAADLSTPDVAEGVKTMNPPSDQRFRISLRPGILYRPVAELTLKSKVYFKLPIDDPHAPDGELDWRLESESSASLALPSEEGDPKVSLTASYNTRRDTAPPVFTVVLADPKDTSHVIEARRSHNQFNLELGIEF